MEWYYAQDGESVGPLSEPDWQQLIASGKIAPDTLVWHDGMAEWQPFSQVQSASLVAEPAPATAKLSLARRTHPCSECGRQFPDGDLLQYESSWVCADCKDVFFQRVREGAGIPSAMDFGGFWIRFGAKFIDGIIKWVVSIVVQLVVVGLGVAIVTGGGNGGGAEAGVLILNVLATALQLGFAAVYETWFLGRYGATPGKMACGLRVVTADGDRLTYGRAFCRHLAEYLSSLLCLIGYIIAAFDDEKRTLHDHICSTRVVRK